MVRNYTGSAGSLPAKITSTLAQIDTALRDTLQMVRDLTEDQFPPVLTAFGLGIALQQLIRNLAPGFNGAFMLHLGEGELALDPARRLNLFRILQIILQRCVTHARATVIEVTCAPSNGHIECVIDHDGKAELWAYDQGNDELPVLQARVTLLGCTFRTTNSPTNHNPRIELLVPSRIKNI